MYDQLKNDIRNNINDIQLLKNTLSKYNKILIKYFIPDIDILQRCILEHINISDQELKNIYKLINSIVN